MPSTITLVKRLTKGSALNATEMDANLQNLSDGITGDYSDFLVAHDSSGSIKTAAGTVNGSALTAGTVGYDKLSSIFYAEDSAADVNTLTLSISELTAAPAVGSVFFVKVNGANTGGVSIGVTTGGVTTNGTVYKNGTEALTNGDLLNNQIVAIAYAGSSSFQLLSNLTSTAGSSEVVKIATVESDSSTHTPSANNPTQITSYPLASNSYSKIIVRATARVIAGNGVTAGVQFYNGSSAVAPSYEMPQMQVPSGTGTGQANLDIKNAPWQTFVAEFDGGNTSTATIYFYKTGTSADYKAELDFLEVYGVI